MFSLRSESGVIYIKDIIKAGKIQWNDVYHILKTKVVYMFDMRTIKAHFSQGSFKIYNSNEDVNPQDLVIYIKYDIQTTKWASQSFWLN